MCAKGPETDKKERDQVSREIGGSLQYVADKVSELMLKSQMNDSLDNNLQFHHLEELRSAAIQKLETFGNDEENKDIIIEALVYLKEKMKEYQEN
jgi:hypothetical protein